MEQIAKIAVAAAIYAIDKAYSYRVPEDISVEIGMRVMVPFGRGNRRSEGVVLDLTPMEDGVFKAIEQALDDKPILTPAMLRMAAWIRGRYFCTMYDAIRGMLPAGFWFTNKEFYRVSTDISDWKSLVKRKPEAALVMEFLVNLGGRAEGGDLRRNFPDEQTLEQNLQYLLKKKVILCDESVSQRLREKTEVMVTLAVTAEEAMEYANRKKTTAPLQFEVLQLLSATGCGSSKEICYFTGCSMTTLRRLETLGLVTLKKEAMAQVLLDVKTEPLPPLELNPEQQAVFAGLKQQMKQEKPGVALLHGVTGSGKTAVYVQLIHRCLQQGRTALVLVPEIGLTPQLLRIFQGYFGEKVAILHSGLSMRGRVDQWKNMESGKATVVVGTRSAVFAPLQNIGLLVVDEEQEHTFLSENKPRYDAREVAMYRGAKEKALVLLGSATPSIESMYRAKEGIYSLYRLEQRFNGKDLPAVSIVDMKEELKAANGSAISRLLAEKLEEAWNESHQAILFLNRRGASRCLVCVDCGTVPTCPNCTVHLTYHSVNNRLICHHCGYSQRKPTRCASCDGPLKELGTGTQKVQEELADQFPATPILRMDGDTISAANSHEKILEQFQKDQIPVMIGTQMVTKGLDFENVTLVGVLDGDTMLYAPYYKSAEETFSMIAQVVGRAGRGAYPGTAVIQTMTPEHAVIALAAKQDYDQFYNMEIQLRKLRMCPPFRQLFTVHFSGVFEDQVRMAADYFRMVVESALGQSPYDSLSVSLLGPTAEIVTKINNLYRYQLTLCADNTKAMREMLSQVLIYFQKQKQSKGIGAFVDINH